MSDGPFYRNADGSLTPAAPIGWQEEHNWLGRLWFWVRRIEHCNDREGLQRSTQAQS